MAKIKARNKSVLDRKKNEKKKKKKKIFFFFSQNKNLIISSKCMQHQIKIVKFSHFKVRGFPRTLKCKNLTIKI
jgi:hypothetical protein